jgi:hypothetical protein
VPRVAAVRFQVAVTYSTNLLTFDSGKSGAVGDSILASVASLRPSVVMARAGRPQKGLLCWRRR